LTQNSNEIFDQWQPTEKCANGAKVFTSNATKTTQI